MDSSSSSQRRTLYDVFISFRGEDTRKTFVSHLDKALCDRGIATFEDNRKLEVGDSIPDELRRAIVTSRFAIVVISEKYATSSWCLDELEMIMEEEEEEKEIEVLPIFYGVKPSQVRNQLGDFSLGRYQDSDLANKVPRWRKALTGIGNRKGKESTQSVDDATLIEEVVQRISSRLLHMLPVDLGYIVGMEAHMEVLSPLLDMDSKSNDARIVGISGTGGIGKTTIAKYLYERFKLRFSPHYCFVENVAKLSGEHGLVFLQQRLLSDIFREENVKLESVEHGRQQLEFRLGGVRVFLVLDDVDDEKQLSALAKDIRWFGAGSRIIITTRDKSLLNSCSGVYDVNLLSAWMMIKLSNSFSGLLINVSTDGFISMHCLLEQKAREIVYQESRNQPKIFYHDNILQLLADKKGTSTTRTEGVVLDVSKMPYHVNIEWKLFKSMENLSFLKICNYKRIDSTSNCNLKGISLPCKLRVLHWEAYPFTALPSIVHHDCHVELNLCHSKLTTLWSRNPPRLLLLQRLYLTRSKDLKELPDLQEAVSLEEFDAGRLCFPQTDSRIHF